MVQLEKNIFDLLGGVVASFLEVSEQQTFG